MLCTSWQRCASSWMQWETRGGRASRQNLRGRVRPARFSHARPLHASTVRVSLVIRSALRLAYLNFYIRALYFNLSCSISNASRMRARLADATILAIRSEFYTVFWRWEKNASLNCYTACALLCTLDCPLRACQMSRGESLACGSQKHMHAMRVNALSVAILFSS